MPTPLFNIPYLDPNTFSVAESNNHYRIIEALMHPIVRSIESTPPTNPGLGDWYEVESSAPTGAFLGQGGKVATKIADYWLFLDPTDVSYHFSSPSNQYYNPVGIIKPATIYSNDFSSANSTRVLDQYSSQMLINANHTNCSIDLTTIPPFKGVITICNNGSETLTVLFQSAITKTIPPITVKTFFSDGSYVFG